MLITKTDIYKYLIYKVLKKCQYPQLILIYNIINLYYATLFYYQS
jgi:hypothetical protein